MAGAPGPIRRAWYQWKMQRFPWRKKWLVGFDLHGNTFWEFKDALHSLRNRRIAKYSRSTHYGDVQISPSWMQWLRHTRFDPALDCRTAARRGATGAHQAASSPSRRQMGSQTLGPRCPGQATARAAVASHSILPPAPLSHKRQPRHTRKTAPRPKKAMAKEPANSPWKQAAQSQDWQPTRLGAGPAKRPS
ncbi:hypothetical protein J3E73DRAFT_360222 [Bipolaris maydis]|nr:hypothetical protein J3E73DRAFT_360222 [Bipolaris maydis]